MFQPDKFTIYKLGNYKVNGIIGMYRFPRSIHKDFKSMTISTIEVEMRVMMKDWWSTLRIDHGKKES